MIEIKTHTMKIFVVTGITSMFDVSSEQAEHLYNGWVDFVKGDTNNQLMMRLNNSITGEWTAIRLDHIVLMEVKPILNRT